MLVLTRNIGQTIKIGDNITITILRRKGRAVSVGIDAPGDVRIVRGEVAGKEPATRLLAHHMGECGRAAGCLTVEASPS